MLRDSGWRLNCKGSRQLDSVVAQFAADTGFNLNHFPQLKTPQAIADRGMAPGLPEIRERQSREAAID